jgi:hypothetical protein
VFLSFPVLSPKGESRAISFIFREKSNFLQNEDLQGRFHR